MNLVNYLKFWFKLNKRELVTNKYESVFDIDWQFIDQNYKVIIFDVDDTISAHKGPLNKRTLQLLNDLKNKQKKLFLLSNCNNKRGTYLKKTLRNLDIKVISNAEKPNPKYILDIINSLGIDNDQYVVIGERVATDLYSAFLAGVSTRILVKPYSEIFGGKKPNLIYKSVRTIENWFAKNT